MFAKGQHVIQMFEQLAPRYLAVPDDKIGLQLGTLQKEIKKVLIALDVVDEVVEEAIREQVDLIIAHHAIIYRPLQHIQTDSSAGKLYEKLIKHDIAVYIAHTNLDVADGGINDMMAQVLQLEQLSILATLKAQPSEEVGSELHRLDLQRETFGLGRVGKLPRPSSLRSLAQQVKTVFNVPMLRVVGDLDRQVSKIAVLGGAGSRYIQHAQFAGADVLITGDIDYHTAHDAAAAGLALIDPGHNIEKIMKREVANYLSGKLQERKFSTEVISSEVNTEPFCFL